jgi:hypothetical protein
MDIRQHIFHILMDLKLRVFSLALFCFVLVEETREMGHKTLDHLNSLLFWHFIGMLFAQYIGHSQIVTAVMDLLEFITN